ncbi:ParB N-terminal domain-containing protein [Rahnella sp. CG8]|uniref:ParB family protein n=1 Tax=Yersiniaceae TaxID=1903411 RepID=UPI001013C9A4|nr:MULTISPECIES: ParB family protein [Yersiniaceae]MCM2446268.1 ParB N-terminal domain-containing protein [Rahnella sp. CG8]
MSDATPQEKANELVSEGFIRNGPAVDILNDPLEDTPMVVTLDELQAYELNPRLTRNPLYDEIKDSIRERGLDAPPAITRRPGAHHYIIRNGGNTRLAILRELWSETKDEHFFRISCLYRPWTERGEIIALTGHLAEGELHGKHTFIERALGVERARELYEQETGKTVSQSELSRLLRADGYPVSQPRISRMQEAIQYLLPAIPTVLYAGMGRPQVEQLTSLRRSAARIWEAHPASQHAHIAFPSLFQDVLTGFDGTAGNFNIQRVKDELIGQMSDLLSVDYDTLTIDILNTEKRWQVLSSEPSIPMMSALSPQQTTEMPPPQPTTALHPAKPVTAPGRTSPEVIPPSSVPSSVTLNNENDAQHTSRISEHIVSPAGTTERLESIQRLIAGHTGEQLPDFENNVLQAIPVQAGGLYPITDVWFIDPALDEPVRLRTHISQFALEIACELDLSDAIETYEAGLGFRCLLPHRELPSLASALLALLHSLSTSYASESPAEAHISTSLLAEHLGLLLLGFPSHAGTSQTQSERLSDNSLVKLFRLLRLGRRLMDIESAIAGHVDAQPGT